MRPCRDATTFRCWSLVRGHEETIFHCSFSIEGSIEGAYRPTPVATLKLEPLRVGHNGK